MEHAFERIFGFAVRDMERALRDLAARRPGLRLARRLAFGGAVALIAVHVAVGLAALIDVPAAEPLWRTRALRIDRDGSVPEVFEYALLGVAALAMLRLWRREGAPAWCVLAVVFALALSDNALMLHERAGRLGPTGSIRVNEVLAFGTAGILAALSVVLAIRASPPEARAPATVCLLTLALAAGFAAGVDFAHGLVGPGADTPLRAAFSTLEDGGELLAVALAAVAAVAAAGRPGAAAGRTGAARASG